MKIYRTSDPNIIRFFCPFCNYKNPVFYFSKKLASQNKNCWFCHHCKKTGKKEEIFDKGIKINYSKFTKTNNIVQDIEFTDGIYPLVGKIITEYQKKAINYLFFNFHQYIVIK